MSPRRAKLAAFCWVAWLALVGGSTPSIAQPGPPARPKLDEPTRQDLLNSFEAVVRGAMEDADPSGRSTALMNIAAAQAGLGDRAAARKTFEAAATSAVVIGEFGDRMSWLRKVVREQLKAKDLDGARMTLNLIARELNRMTIPTRLNCRIEIATGLVEAGRRDIAREKFQETLESLEDFDGNVGLWEASLGNVVSAMVSVGELDLALDAAEAVPTDNFGIRNVLIRKVAGGAESASPEVAENALLRARRLAIQAPGENPQILINGSLALARARRGDLPSALKGVGMLTSDVAKAGVLFEIVLARLKADDIAGATEIARMIGKDARDPRALDSKPWALVEIAKRQAVRGDLASARNTLAEAIGVAKGLESEVTKAEQLQKIAIAQAGIGDTEGALKTANAIDGDDHRKGLALVAIVLALVKAGKKGDDVFPTLNRAMEAIGPGVGPANQINGNVGRNRQDAIRQLAGAFAETGSIDEAMTLAKTINDKYEREYTMTDIAVIQARKGDVDGALKTVAQILGMLRRALAFGQVARVQAEAGHAADARVWVDKLESPTFRARAYKAMVEGLTPAPLIPPDRGR